MEDKKKEGRYQRIFIQLGDLINKSNDPLARMATICAVLHHKFDTYFWTGFYMLKEGHLIVGPYQGPVSCQELADNKGVCWAAVNQEKPVIVPDVRKYPGHIACDSRSKSEIALPLFDQHHKIHAVLDVDSSQLNTFNEIDAYHLERILKLIFSGEPD